MAADPTLETVPSPASWPEFVKSAIVHVIYSAHTSPSSVSCCLSEHLGLSCTELRHRRLGAMMLASKPGGSSRSRDGPDAYSLERFDACVARERQHLG